MLAPKRLALAGTVLLAAAVVAVVVLDRGAGDPTPLTVGWGGSEGRPSCEYDAGSQTVTARLEIEGTPPRPEQVTVTVTAYADENTSEPVGSSSRSVRVEGTAHRTLLVPIRVTGRPHVGEDDETACRLEVAHGASG